MTGEVEFVGATGTVTGSMHLIRSPQANILLDCGLYQGRRAESYLINSELRISPKDVDVVVLSHAHIDHCGALPILYKSGYRHMIWTTPATRDLCAVMLRDAAYIQEADANYINNSLKKEHSEVSAYEPL